jgi:hypothetical protein
MRIEEIMKLQQVYLHQCRKQSQKERNDLKDNIRQLIAGSRTTDEDEFDPSQIF